MTEGRHDTACQARIRPVCARARRRYTGRQPGSSPAHDSTAALLAFTLAAAILTVTPGAVFIAFGLKLALERR
jgi:hypothetical protein